MFRPHKELIWTRKTFYKCKKCGLSTFNFIDWSLEKNHYWGLILVNNQYSNKLTESGEDYVKKYGNTFCRNPTPMDELETKHYKVEEIDIRK